MKPKAPLSRSLHSIDVDGPGCGAQAFLSPTHKVPGFHLACVEQQPGGRAVSVTLFPLGQGAGNQTLVVPMTGEAEEGPKSARAVLFVRHSRKKKKGVPLLLVSLAAAGGASHPLLVLSVGSPEYLAGGPVVVWH